MIKVPIHEAQRDLAPLIEAALAGEEVFIVTETDVVVQLTHVPSADSPHKFDSLKGQVSLPDDRDELSDGFARYM